NAPQLRTKLGSNPLGVVVACKQKRRNVGGGYRIYGKASNTRSSPRQANPQHESPHLCDTGDRFLNRPARSGPGSPRAQRGLTHRAGGCPGGPRIGLRRYDASPLSEYRLRSSKSYEISRSGHEITLKNSVVDEGRIEPGRVGEADRVVVHVGK